jgi:hypothetical protein
MENSKSSRLRRVAWSDYGDEIGMHDVDSPLEQVV